MKAVVDCEVWVIDRVSFNQILRSNGDDQNHIMEPYIYIYIHMVNINIIVNNNTTTTTTTTTNHNNDNDENNNHNEHILNINNDRMIISPQKHVSALKSVPELDGLSEHDLRSDMNTSKYYSILFYNAIL